ncbi:MAG: LamG-like jellyroll fold domain-containing protein [Myxococcota bacterium]
MRCRESWAILIVALLASGCGEEPATPFDEAGIEMLGDGVRDTTGLLHTLVSDPVVVSGDTSRAVVLPHRSEFESLRATIHVRMTFDTVDGDFGVLSKDADGYADGGHFRIFTRDNDLVVRGQSSEASEIVVASGVLRPGVIHDIVVVIGHQIRVFLDGERVASAPFSVPWNQNRESIVVGGSASLSDSGVFPPNRIRDPLEGEVHRATLYARVLSESEIRWLSSDRAHSSARSELDADFFEHSR